MVLSRKGWGVPDWTRRPELSLEGSIFAAMNWTAIVCVAVGLGQAVSLPAQQQAQLQVGVRVRVTSDSGGGSPQVGTFRGMGGGVLQLQTGTSLVTIPLDRISRLEQSRGKSFGIAGGIIGALLGTGVGMVAGCLVNQDDYGVFCGGQDDTKVIVGGVLGGVSGGILGALLFRRERWTAVDPSSPGSR
jgi:hypothetical protein